MVKIRVTGERTFEWLAAKYDTNYSVKCTTSSNFSEQCFKGTSVTQAMYNVELVATANKGMAFFQSAGYLVVDKSFHQFLRKLSYRTVAYFLKIITKMRKKQKSILLVQEELKGA